LIDRKVNVKLEKLLMAQWLRSRSELETINSQPNIHGRLNMLLKWSVRPRVTAF